MKKLCILIFIVGVNLSSYAPNLDKEFVKSQNEQIIKEVNEKLELLERLSKLLRTIRIIETRENYNLQGLSGEYGAYQFTKKTWEFHSKKYFNEVLDITIPENQDKVAQKKVIELINKGYNDAEIASIWNCGSKYYKGKVGVNKYGIKYNVPKYVKEFLIIKNRI